MKTLLSLGLSLIMLITLVPTQGCRSTIHSRWIYQGDWAVTKKVKRKHAGAHVKGKKKVVNSRMFNQPGGLKF